MRGHDADLLLFDEAGQPTPQAHARTSDPHTSHEAAGSVTAKLRESQEAVLTVLDLYGPFTDVDLVDRYNRVGYAHSRPQSPSGIRSRRHELVEAGKVVDTGRREKLPSGRNAIVWAAV